MNSANNNRQEVMIVGVGTFENMSLAADWLAKHTNLTSSSIYIHYLSPRKREVGPYHIKYKK